MATQELINFIKEELAQGKTLDSITSSLTSSGWQSQGILEAFNAAGVKVDFTGSSNPLSKLPKLSMPLIVGLVILFLGFSAVLGYWGYRSFFSQNVADKNNNISKKSQSPTPTIMNPTPTPLQNAISDCGTENLNINLGGQGSVPPPHTKLGCFISAANSCSTSKLATNWIVSVGTDPSNTTVITDTIYYDIAKDNNNKCVLHLRYGQGNGTFPPGTSQEIQQSQLSTIKKYENSEGKCLFVNNADVVDIFSKFDKGEFTLSNQPGDSPYTKGECLGTYFDLLNKNPH